MLPLPVPVAVLPNVVPQAPVPAPSELPRGEPAAPVLPRTGGDSAALWGGLLLTAAAVARRLAARP
ncbi:MAG TPA: hypothetical protein VM264_05540 [Acidimicrobiales bacterium]|nr:hypothetical protein [Acidimicrobiales bacterium]